MSLETLVKVVGWALVGVPTATFIAIATYLFIGAAKDDETIMALEILAAVVFAIGVAILVLIYSTDFFPALLESQG